MNFIWPFAVKDKEQFRRIDQGWDLQTGVGEPILAVADGTIRYGHNAPGFGDPYPILDLDEPAYGHRSVYYGHNHPVHDPGTKVIQGETIAYTLAKPGGNASNLPGWLEIGFYPPGDMTAGKAMQAALVNAPTMPELHVQGKLTMNWFSAIDPDTDGLWLCNAKGQIYAYDRDGNPTGRNLGQLDTHPDWKAGTATNPVVAFTNWKDDTGAHGYQIWTEDANGLHGFHFDAAGSQR